MKFWNFKIMNEDTPEEKVELRIEGEIVSDDEVWFYEWFGIKVSSPNAFRAELAKYSGKNIKVWIDSFGGDVFAGVGLYNALKEHKGKITTIIDGKAMSAATIPAMAGEELQMTPGSMLMIHNPWTQAAGEAKDMIHTADILSEVKESIINVYRTKTNRTHKKISEMMDNETWMSAKTAIAEGFADKMLYTGGQANEPVDNALMFSRLAIQNSISSTMTKALEAMKKIKPEAFKSSSETAVIQPKPQEESQQSLVDLYTKIKARNERRKTHV